MTFDTNTNIDWSPDGATGESLSLQSDVPLIETFATPEAALNSAEKRSPFHPRFGHWFRPELNGQSDRFQRLSSFVFEQIVAGMNRKRGLKQQDARDLRSTVDAVIANALGAFWHREPKRLAFSRRYAVYADKSIWPDWLSARKLTQVVDGMTLLGCLLTHIGVQGQASQFEAADGLLELSDKFGVTASDLSIAIPRARLVRMKDTRKRLIPFEPTPETEAWKDQLGSYNAFMSDQDVSLDIAPEQKLAMMFQATDDASGLKIVMPELYSRSIYRVFNDGTFDHGGRLYGAWWQQIPSSYRQHIKINGEPTVELDYSGFAIRSIYHQTGIDYRDDPYELEDVCALAEAQGLDRHHYRESIKALAQALLNGKSGNPERIPLPHSFRGHFTRRQLFEMLMKQHDPIRWAFASGEGVRNQRLDSDIACEIVSFMTQSEIPILTIHDSFIVKEEDQFILECTMNRIYFEKIGFYPSIKHRIC